VARVLVTRLLPAGGTDPLTAAGHDVVQRTEDVPYGHEELVSLASGVDGIVCLLTDRIDEEVLAAGASAGLRVVANVAVGYDNIDVAAAHRLGVAVCNTPGVLDETTADLAFLLVLAASRLASDAEHDLRHDAWPGWGVTQYLGRDVHGATLGLVGYGRIGRAVARRRQASACRCCTTPAVPRRCPATWRSSSGSWPRRTWSASTSRSPPPPATSSEPASSPSWARTPCS